MAKNDDYFRRDQRGGVTAPLLGRTETYAEHIVHARGKRTQFTSVSLEPARIRLFGDTTYALIRDRLLKDKHVLITHDALMAALKQSARDESREARLKAVHAIRHARRRKEGLVDWRFDITGIPSKDLLSWAVTRIQPYFRRAR